MDFDLYLLDKYRRLLPDTEPELLSGDYIIIEEFDNWVIRLKNPTGESPLLHWGEDRVPLEYSEELKGYVWPFFQNGALKDVTKAKSTAGYLHLLRRSGSSYQMLQPSIFIVAGSLLDDQYPLLLDRLGQLAIADRAAMTAPIEGVMFDELADDGQWLHTPIIARVLAFLRFYAVCRRTWSQILIAPAQTITSINRRSRLDTASAQRSPQTQRHVVTRPGANKIELSTHIESFDTAENRFLKFVLNHTHIYGKLLKKSLDDLSEKLLDTGAEPPEQDAIAAWRQGRATASAAAKVLKRLGEDLTEVVAWSKRQSGLSIFRGVLPILPQNPSLRLTRSPGYAPIYRAFRDLFGDFQQQVKLDQVRRGLMERTVRPTHELYEIWLFLELYTLLMEKFGFRPVGKVPAAHLELQAGRLRLQHGQMYELELNLKNDQLASYRLRLFYEPSVYYTSCRPGKNCYLTNICEALPCYDPNGRPFSLGPDVVLEAEHNGQTYRFAIDAKYRRYATQPPFRKDFQKYQVQNNYEVDVLGTAKQKYRNGIPHDAAFVVHSDPDPAYTYFGEAPFLTPPHREEHAKLSLYAGHEYGAVYAAPSKIANLEKLLKCLLMYHAGWYDICWTCRKRLQAKPGTGKGVYYQCEHGHDFWVHSNCGRHLLIKLGASSFHQTLPNNEWNCVCPKCGSVARQQVRLYQANQEEPPPWVGRNGNIF